MVDENYFYLIESDSNALLPAVPSRAKMEQVVCCPRPFCRARIAEGETESLDLSAAGSKKKVAMAVDEGRRSAARESQVPDLGKPCAI